jgi:GNAT superfamily N-acetyltransferase
MSADTENRVWTLPDGYEIRLLSPEAIEPLLAEWQPKIFSSHGSIFPQFTDAEREATKRLRAHMGAPLQLGFGIFHGDTFVGWHVGNQRTGLEFYMRNSAVLPEHRGRGLYAALLRTVKEYLLELGFQEISSRHNATNNAVIVPKLKQGFVITALEASDVFGTLVHLTYFASARRRATLDFRVGMAHPDEEMLQAMRRGHG